MIWRVPCKNYPIVFQDAKCTWDCLGHGTYFFLICLMKPSFFSGWHPKKSQVLLPTWKNRVDLTGYPSNHFPECRLNGRLIAKKLRNSTVIINLARRQCTYSRCLVQNAEIKRRILLHTFRYILWCHWRKKSKQWRNEFRYCSWSKVDYHFINEIVLYFYFWEGVALGQSCKIKLPLYAILGLRFLEIFSVWN